MTKRIDKRPLAYLITVILSLTLVIAGAIIQLNSELTGVNCSYFDPISIDIAAFLVSFFLIVEGLSKIQLNKDDTLNMHLTRAVRVAIGFSIFALHIVQFSYK